MENCCWRLMAVAEACDAVQAAGAVEPSGLDAAESEALRQCLYAAGSPCLVPDEAIASTEFYFDEGTLTELWKCRMKSIGG